MTKRFKVGDRARLVGSKGFPERIGEELTVIGMSNGLGYDYLVRFDRIDDPVDAVFWAADNWQLETIIDLGSWEMIEKDIGWKPGKEKLKEKEQC